MSQFDCAVSLRRELHNLAEPSGKEILTSAYIVDFLRRNGIAVQSNIAGHGVVGIIDSGREGPVVMLRADMDAIAYADPEHPNEVIVEHTCGHDAHIACLLTAGLALRNCIDRGRVKLVFQPSEENLLGALAMIDAGVVADVDYALASHVMPLQDLPFGIFSPSVHHNAAATVKVTVHGVQAHAAYEHLGINPVEAAAHLISATGLVKINALKRWSIKATRISGEKGSSGTIASFVDVIFDVQTEDDALMEELLYKLRNTVDGTARIFGTHIDLTIKNHSPAYDYDPELETLISETVVELFGESALGPKCACGGEDFHFYKKARPSLRCAYFGIGAACEPGLHTRGMHFDESILPETARLLTRITQKILSNPN
ncbi:MAG: amidohydrolase [Duodenibacillus sp.]